ncbi:MAG: hypothetical protein JXP73_03630 [Deltaproteobacteria bacterium]|jgi:hypothetical protein|nr:hypothetical protein [Deltaproteobacteria bacterium]
MSPASPPAPPAPRRRKSSRNAWLVVLGLLAALAITTVILWQKILAKIEATRPELLLLVAVATWAATVLAMYLWRIGSLLRARAKARRAAEALFERLQRQVDAAFAEAIELAVVTTEWAVRAELVRDDFEDVQEYMQGLAKRPRVRRAFVAKRDGTVIGAGDRRQRGSALGALVSGLPAESSSVQKVPCANNGMLLVVPVMGLESRLGTFVLEVERPVLTRADGE